MERLSLLGKQRTHDGCLFQSREGPFHYIKCRCLPDIQQTFQIFEEISLLFSLDSLIFLASSRYFSFTICW